VYTPMDRTLILELHAHGLTQCAIARRLGCHRNTVRNALRTGPPSSAERVANRWSGPGRPGAPSKVSTVRERIAEALTGDPSLPTGALFTRARQEWGYQGRRSAFYALAKSVRPAAAPALMTRFEGLPGEYAQFDFGQAVVSFAGGRKERVHFFAGRLKFSRYMHARRTPDERSESLVRAVVDCLHAWQGSPSQWVFDNPTTVWVRLANDRRELHADLRQLVADMNVCVEPCTPRMANQKGAVENLVKFVKRNFLPGRVFADVDDFDRQLAQWLHYVNQERVCDATKEIPATRLAQEAERLAKRPVPWTAATYPLRVISTVGPTGLVTVHGTPYSVNPRKLGAPATVLVRQTTMEFQIGDESVTHPRDDGSRQPHRKAEHSLAEVAMVTEGRKRTYIKREYLLNLGPAARTFIDQVVTQQIGHAWYPIIHRLYDLATAVPATVFLAACESCHRQQRYTAHAIQAALNGEAA